jgi:hypothetical protein
MSTIHRLPVQHPKAPHCPSCGKDLPTFNSAALDLDASDIEGFELAQIRITFLVRCGCEQLFELTKSLF